MSLTYPGEKAKDEVQIQHFILIDFLLRLFSASMRNDSSFKQSWTSLCFNKFLGSSPSLWELPNKIFLCEINLKFS